MNTCIVCGKETKIDGGGLAVVCSERCGRITSISIRLHTQISDEERTALHDELMELLSQLQTT